MGGEGEYRRKGVSLQRLRPVIAALREEFQTPYPLATVHPFISANNDLVLELQERNDVPTAIGIVIRTGQTVSLAPDARRFFRKVEFDAHHGHSARRLKPAGDSSPVLIDPLVRFGRPSVQGVTTERLWELHDAGETLEEVADGYEMALTDVGAAIAYEEQQRTLAA